jgi:hypothetical protein
LNKFNKNTKSSRNSSKKCNNYAKIWNIVNRMQTCVIYTNGPNKKYAFDQLISIITFINKKIFTLFKLIIRFYQYGLLNYRTFQACFFYVVAINIKGRCTNVHFHLFPELFHAIVFMIIGFDDLEIFEQFTLFFSSFLKYGILLFAPFLTLLLLTVQRDCYFYLTFQLNL